MATEGFKRKLTAILSADVAGYSRLMGEDEAQTVKTITAYREVMSELIKQHRGRVIDSPGDNLLAEFASVADAAQNTQRGQAYTFDKEGFFSIVLIISPSFLFVLAFCSIL
jgi:class 3 adenylate cyclase